MMVRPTAQRWAAVGLGIGVALLCMGSPRKVGAQVSEDKVLDLVNHLWYPYDREPRERAKMHADAVASLSALAGTQGKKLVGTLAGAYERSSTEPRMKVYIVRTVSRISVEHPDSEFARAGHAFCRELVRTVEPSDPSTRLVWIEATNNLKLNRDLSVVPAYIERFTDSNMTPRFRKARVETFNVLLGTQLHPLSVERETRLPELRDHWTQWWTENKPFAEYYFALDPKTGKRLWRSPGIRINRLALSRWRVTTDRLVASAGADDTARLWDGRGGVAGHVLYGADETVVGLAIHPKASVVAAGDALGHLRVYRVLDGEQVQDVAAHKHSIWDLDFGPKGDVLVSAGADGDVHLWDARTWTRTRTLQTGSTTVYASRFSPDGAWVATGARDGPVRLWPVGTDGSPRALKTGDAGPVYALAFSPDGRRLAAATRSGQVLVWDVGSGKRVHRLKVGSDAVTGVAWITRGNALVTADQGARVSAWNLSTRQIYLGYQNRGEPLYSLDVSADGQYLAAGGRHRLVTEWAVHEGTRVRILHGHRDAVMKVRFARTTGKVLMKGVPRFGYVVDWVRSNSHYTVTAPAPLRQRPLDDLRVSAPTLRELLSRIDEKVGCKHRVADRAIEFLPK